MSRFIIGGIVCVVIGVLTAAASYVSTSRIESRIRTDLNNRVMKAQELLVQNASLEGLGILKQVEMVSRTPDLVRAVRATKRSERSKIADLAFQGFKSSLAPEEAQPDILALTDSKGNVIAELDVANPLSAKWKDGNRNRYRSVDLALNQRRRQITSEIWDDPKLGLMKVGVAPVLDPEAESGREVIGALVIGYSITAAKAADRSSLLGADVAYFSKGRIFATSFQQNARSQLAKVLEDKGLGIAALTKGLADQVVEVKIRNKHYFATAGRLERFSSRPLPAEYPAPTAGALVMMSLSDAIEPLSSIRLVVVLLGIAALVVALLAVMLAAKRILHQTDQLELGIHEIINGNLDKTFRRVGSDLDGLAHALNVMLARLLGRPEPGDEEYDEDGNVIQPSALHFDTGSLSAADSEIVALAQEPEPDYYKRVYQEYVKARKEVGEGTENVTYEGFVTKLRLNETNLKAKYQSRAVRFKVVVIENKVTLKPVPIV